MCTCILYFDFSFLSMLIEYPPAGFVRPVFLGFHKSKIAGWSLTRPNVSAFSVADQSSVPLSTAVMRMRLDVASLQPRRLATCTMFATRISGVNDRRKTATDLVYFAHAALPPCLLCLNPPGVRC